MVGIAKTSTPTGHRTLDNRQTPKIFPLKGAKSVKVIRVLGFELFIADDLLRDFVPFSLHYTHLSPLLGKMVADLCTMAATTVLCVVCTSIPSSSKLHLSLFKLRAPHASNLHMPLQNYCDGAPMPPVIFSLISPLACGTQVKAERPINDTSSPPHRATHTFLLINLFLVNAVLWDV